MQICPHCGRENPDTDPYCYACGHILPVAARGVMGATDKLDDDFYESLEPRRRWGTAYFQREGQLRLRFRDTSQTLALNVDREVVLGRAHEEPDVPQPDIDLSPYGAVEKGVSRIHLKLTRDQDTLVVMDLGSANGTFMNGQRLIPYEPRILRDNDELRLGRLVMRATFS